LWPHERGIEERSADFCRSLTLSEVSQLAQDASTALVATREWRNTFVRVNRIPADVLSLIPTHLSQGDRFRASFVCRHWRRTFLHNATLWSQLNLSKGEVYVKTLLERTKGSALDITVNGVDPTCAMALLPPHAQQIRFLDFVCNNRVDIIQRFSEVNSGSLPLLTTLRITAVDDFGLERPVDIASPSPSLSLFSHAVNLNQFFLHSNGSLSLRHFRFPNLTTFELWAVPEEDFRASQLLDFLEASPMLRTVDMKIITDIVLEGVPRERIVVLPNVETFRLAMRDGGDGYEIATHISCPSARSTSLTHETYNWVTFQEIFPSSISWNAIVRQYAGSPVEGVILEMRIGSDHAITCSLAFRSSDATTTRLDFKVAASHGYGGDFLEMYCEAFSHASRTIRDHPLLANVKRLCFNHSYYSFDYTQHRRIANDVGQLFKCVGPLEELTLNGCDLQSYLIPFLDHPEPYDIEQPVAFPIVKKLKISHPVPISCGECATIIVRLAKSQHALGVPFERVTIHMEENPSGMVVALGRWVGLVGFCAVFYEGDPLDYCQDRLNT
jgi:hypothetical protein